MILFCRSPVQINEQVSTADQVDFGEGRIFDHVLLGKNQQIADGLLDTKNTFVRLLGEKTGQAFR